MDAFWSQKSLKNQGHFFDAFLGSGPSVAPLRRDFGGTSAGLRRDFDARVSTADPPQGGALYKKKQYNNVHTMGRKASQGRKRRKHEIQHALGRWPGEFI